MNIKITKDMIKDGYRQDIIQLSKKDESSEKGVICRIGDYSFSFGGEKAETMTPCEYVINIPQETIINEIYEALEGFKNNPDKYEHEYTYYYHYLKNLIVPDERIEEGILTIITGKIDVTDPCYDKDTWCRINDLPVKNGDYHCIYFRREGRVAEAIISLSGETNLEWEEVGDIGVDAGLAGFFINKPDYDDPEWDEFCDKLDFENKEAYLYPDAFFTESGWGDGWYEVFGVKENNKYIALKIVFIPED